MHVLRTHIQLCFFANRGSSQIQDNHGSRRTVRIMDQAITDWQNDPQHRLEHHMEAWAATHMGTRQRLAFFDNTAYTPPATELIDTGNCELCDELGIDWAMGALSAVSMARYAAAAWIFGVSGLTNIPWACLKGSYSISLKRCEGNPPPRVPPLALPSSQGLALKAKLLSQSSNRSFPSHSSHARAPMPQLPSQS
jgi:hypothetical protein